MTIKKSEIEGVDINTYAGKAIQACKLKARGIFGDELLTFKLLDFVSFFILNNELSSKGYTITEDNREEVYIKIIETGDVQLINDLEKYINLRDSIKELEKKKDEYYSIVEKLSSLQNLNDENEVNEIVESYLRR
jgi:flagellar motility protein MotE (MotC chaperone)